jgi:hypothetical protein
MEVQANEAHNATAKLKNIMQIKRNEAQYAISNR